MGVRVYRRRGTFISPWRIKSFALINYLLLLLLLLLAVVGLLLLLLLL